MICIVTSSAQTIAVGSAITFSTVLVNTGCKKCNSGATTKLTTRGNHLVTFSGNIGASTATTLAQLTICNDGNPIVGAVMKTVTEAAGDLNNVACSTVVNNCCGDYGTITVVNTGTTTLNVDAGATLTITDL